MLLEHRSSVPENDDFYVRNSRIQLSRNLSPGVKMKILFVAPSNSVHTSRWLERARNSGIEVILFDLAIGDKAIPIDGITRYELKPSPWKMGVITDVFEMITAFISLRRIQRLESPELIHLHWLFHGAQVAASYLPNIKKVATPWGSDIQVPMKPLRGRMKMVLANRFIIRAIVRKSVAFCCDSQKLKEILLRNGAGVSSVEIIYFGTDISKFSPHNRSDALREKFGAVNQDILVISNRSHEEVYDIPTLINAAEILFPSHSNIKFVIAGSGALTNSYKQLIESKNLTNVFYFTGRLNDFEFISATASCDIYVSTSKSDGGLAASTAEAMACEVPVIISNFGENGDWLCKEKAGFLFPVGDAEVLAEKIEMLAESKQLRQQMGAVGRSKISVDNNSDLEWQKVLQIYKNIIR